MLKINIKEARQRFKELLDRAEHGEEIIILRRGEAVAKLISVGNKGRRLPILEDFRKSIGGEGISSVNLLREERDER